MIHKNWDSKAWRWRRFCETWWAIGWTEVWCRKFGVDRARLEGAWGNGHMPWWLTPYTEAAW
jgi:hypothetical protein